MKPLSLLFFTTSLCLAQQVDWIAQVRNKPFVDIRSSGAKGDGTTDDSAIFNSVISTLYSAGG